MRTFHTQMQLRFEEDEIGSRFDIAHILNLIQSLQFIRRKPKLAEPVGNQWQQLLLMEELQQPLPGLLLLFLQSSHHAAVGDPSGSSLT